jgi:CubicO group peptidase (beta-lactamase class C family)
MSWRGLDKLVEKAIHDGVFPGACYAIGHKGQVRSKAFGRDTYCPESPKRELDTIWDLASVSKVVGTTTGAMILYDEGKFKLDQPVAEIIPAFGQNEKDRITIRNLLLHDSGLVAFRPYHKLHKTPEEDLAAIYAEKLSYTTGAKTVYSDLGMITFGKIIEALSGKTLDAFLSERVFEPLGMKDTMYNPATDQRVRCASTESIEAWREELRKAHGKETDEIRRLETHPDGNRWIRGEVHDPNATALGGVAGHAGLFSTAADLSIFMGLLLKGGGSIVKPETLNLFTTRKSEASSRAFGWDTKSPDSSAGKIFSDRSYGHTGYTGTSVWADPEQDVFAILLTNRVHPTSENTKIIKFRPVFHDAAMKALGKG